MPGLQILLKIYLHKYIEFFFNSEVYYLLDSYVIFAFERKLIMERVFNFVGTFSFILYSYEKL